MSIVILDAMESENYISEALVETIRDRGIEPLHFKLENMEILQCRSCGACSFKSPGKCIVKDDMHDILREIAKCSVLIMLTPIRFGGYSSNLKKAADKLMHLCLPTYTVKYGHLLHPARYGTKFMLGIGVYAGNSKDEESSYKRLVENNALNVQYKHKAIVLKQSEDIAEVKEKVACTLREVC
ncbi:MAG: NAD(P)H-dependent oxidoreductase [Clostridia bacterium]|nr:NAD(P)H-dependent oxidoreductase [Clostridia bacterium]